MRLAESLGYTPSAISQQLTNLEKSSGVEVLERVGRNVRLTDAGRELVRHADSLLAGMEAAQVAVESITNEVRGALEMTVYESVAATLLPALLARIADEHPDLSIRTRQYDPDLAMDDLAAGDIDLAFAIDYRHAPAPPRDDIIRYPVLEDTFHAVVPVDDPIRGSSVELSDLADRPFISSPPGLSCGRCVVAACRAAGFEPDVVHQLDDYPTTLQLVASGHGVALVPDLGLGNPPDGLRILRLESPLSRTVELAYRTASQHRPSIVAVRDTLVDVARDWTGASAAA